MGMLLGFLICFSSCIYFGVMSSSTHSKSCYLGSAKHCQELEARVLGHKTLISSRIAADTNTQVRFALSSVPSHTGTEHFENISQHFTVHVVPACCHPLVAMPSSTKLHVVQQASGLPDARRLTTSIPAPIRILPVYQLPSTLSSASQSIIQQIVTAAILTLQTYVQVRNLAHAQTRSALWYSHRYDIS